MEIWNHFFFRKLTWTKVWVLKVQPISYGEMGLRHKAYLMIFQRVPDRRHCRILRNHQICQKFGEKKKSMFFRIIRIVIAEKFLIKNL